MDNPWLDRRVLAYAHQGGAREGPSSTMWALHHAVEVGADALELDVHATCDGHLVVCHDATVDRTTEGTGAIAAMTLAEVRALDNAYWWTPGEVVSRDASEYPLRGHGLGIATLDEVLEAFPDTFLNFDIKQTAPAVEPYEEKLAAALRSHGRADGVIVASFNDLATDAFRTFAPEVATSAGTMAVAAFWRAAHTGDPLPPMPHVALQVPVETGGVTVLDEILLAAAHRQGLAVHAWTIDDRDEMERLVAMGVDGIMSDVPSVLAAVLRDHAASHASMP